MIDDARCTSKVFVTWASSCVDLCLLHVGVPARSSQHEPQVDHCWPVSVGVPARSSQHEPQVDHCWPVSAGRRLSWTCACCASHRCQEHRPSIRSVSSRSDTCNCLTAKTILIVVSEMLLIKFITYSWEPAEVFLRQMRRLRSML